MQLTGPSDKLYMENLKPANMLLLAHLGNSIPEDEEEFVRHEPIKCTHKSRNCPESSIYISSTTLRAVFQARLSAIFDQYWIIPLAMDDKSSA